MQSHLYTCPASTGAIKNDGCAFSLSLANFAREAECCWLRCFLFVRRGAIRSVEAREREKILVIGCVSDEKYCPKKKKEIITGTSQA